MFNDNKELDKLKQRVKELEEKIRLFYDSLVITSWNKHYKKEYKWELDLDKIYVLNSGPQYSLYLYESAYNNYGIFIQKRSLCNHVPPDDAHLVPLKPEDKND